MQNVIITFNLVDSKERKTVHNYHYQLSDKIDINALADYMDYCMKDYIVNNGYERMFNERDNNDS